MSAVKDSLEDDENEHTEERKIPHTEYTVSSEVNAYTKGEVINGSSAVLSRFVFTNPFVKNNTKLPDTKDVSVDCDGDLQVVRKNQVSSRKEEVLLIEHQSATTLDLVGEQVWGGALYLADFILHKPDIFEGKHVLELAAGVGLTAIVAAMFAKQVTVTDIDRGDILKLISRNLNRNAHLLSADTEVKEIDFTNHQTIDVMGEHLKNVSVIIVADAIYDNRLTDSFLNTVLRLMSEPPSKTLYLALEKRYVFTLEDMDSVAPCYEYLLTRLDWLCCQNLSLVEWNIKLLDPLSEQYFTYERNKNLIIYEIQARVKDKDITA
ncbi:methyltransferase-like protein 22 isoform X3 [Macrobrachium rosenbergii]|uniref:methyltransferase-like protein 22 isoform X3 n=1 Tax=Macrobrachium rosenbergii TaxID=79674 RepID=UPI0034D66F64